MQSEHHQSLTFKARMKPASEEATAERSFGEVKEEETRAGTAIVEPVHSVVQLEPQRLPQNTSTIHREPIAVSEATGWRGVGEGSEYSMYGGAGDLAAFPAPPASDQAA